MDTLAIKARVRSLFTVSHPETELEGSQQREGSWKGQGEGGREQKAEIEQRNNHILRGWFIGFEILLNLK